MKRILAVACAAFVVGCAQPYRTNCTLEKILQVGASISYVKLQCGHPNDKTYTYIDGVGSQATLLYCGACNEFSTWIYLHFENGELEGWTIR